jgi:lipopolysaccharide export system protein LptA
MLRVSSAFGSARLLRFCAFAALAVGGGVIAQSQGRTSHNSQSPVNYAADRIELQDKQNRVLLSGNVVITQDDLRMTADRTVVAYTNDGGIKIQRIDAVGNVKVTRGEERADADVANYDFNRRLITLVGNVVLHRSNDVSRGGRLVIDLNAHHTAFVGSQSQSGRVTGSFSVAKPKN